ncbi:MAG: FkbM family methyltransferase [Candidatus Neptunochlamydia sp.]|nr:FkbM family methyltransferase [Candidatus Neptunochlamydia sp.]
MEKDMKKHFRKYCEYLNQEHKEFQEMSLIVKLRNQLESQEIDFYEFLNSMYQWNKNLHLTSQNLTHTGIEKIELTDSCVTYTTKRLGIKLIFDGKDRRGVPFELLSFGGYESNELALFDNILNDDSILFDVGANIGWYALNWSKQFPNSTIYAFEPIPQTYDFLKTNAIINGSKNIHPYQLALSNSSGSKPYYFTPESSVLASEKNILEYKNAKKINVTTTTIDGFIENTKIKKLDLIKCDVEGAELNSIKGALKTIKNYQPIVVLELFHEWSKWFDYHPNEAFSLLAKFGYSAFLPEKGFLEKVDSYQSEDFSKQNYFFLHNQTHEKLIQRFSKRKRGG